MTDEFDDYADDGFVPPELDPPAADAPDPRRQKVKRRRRAPSAQDQDDATAQASSKAEPKKKPAEQDWGFGDEEESKIAEWKLGLVLVLVLLVGFGFVAWRKYDTIKAIASEKIDTFRNGDETVVQGDTEDSGVEGDDLLAKVELAPPASPRTDLELPTNRQVPDPTDQSSAMLASFGDAPSTPTRPASDTQPLPPVADIGWGTPSQPNQKPEPEQDVAFDFDLPPVQPEPEPTTTAAAPTNDPFAIDDPFALPVEPVAQPEQPAAMVESLPADTDPFAFDLDPVEPVMPQEPAATLPADEPVLAFDLPAQPTAEVAPFALPVEPLETLPEEPASSPFGNLALDAPEPIAPEPVAPAPAPRNDPFAVTPVPTREPVADTNPFAPPAQPPARPEPQPFDLGLEPVSPTPSNFGSSTAELPINKLPMSQPAMAQPTIPRPEPQVGPTRVDTEIATRRHTVDQGENFWSISKSQYGTVRYFAALAEWNKSVVADPRHLRAGMTIELPPADMLEPLTKTARLPTSAPRRSGMPATLRPEAHQARRHRVQSGENYWSISKTQYGTSRYFAALAEWNKKAVPEPRKLRAGTIIELPTASDLEPLVATASPDGPAPPKSTDTGTNGYFETARGEPRYRVGPNESLSSIAQATLGRASRWRQIYGMNRDALTSPQIVPKGAVLRLPLDATKIAAAQ